MNEDVVRWLFLFFMLCYIFFLSLFSTFLRRVLLPPFFCQIFWFRADDGMIRFSCPHFFFLSLCGALG